MFALGDCACNSTAALPPIASVAEQQGQYLSDCFNLYYKDHPRDSEDDLPLPGKVPASLGMPFSAIRWMYAKSATFHHYSVGGMASLGFGDG